MQEFLFIFRVPTDGQQPQTSPEQLQSRMKAWQDWLGGIAAQDKLVSAGNRLAPDGNTVKPSGLITNGPYVEIKEAVGGYSIVKVDTLEEATELAKGCPVFLMNGTVEVRPIVAMG